MKNTKLVRVLSVLNSDELKHLHDFVNSPFYNTNNNVRLLFDFLHSFAPDFDHPEFTIEKAFKYIFPNKTLNEKAVTKIASKLYRLIILFIDASSSLNNNQLRAEVKFLSFLNQRSLNTDYGSHLKKLRKQFEGITIHDAEFFYQKFLLEEEVSKLQVFQTNTWLKDNNYQKTAQALDQFYLINKLIYCCHLLAYTNIQIHGNVQFELMEGLEAYIPKSPYIENVTILLWYKTFQLLKLKDKNEAYFELKELVFNHDPELSPLDVRNIFTHLQNCASIVFAHRKADYYLEIFELFKFQIERKILTQTNSLTPLRFLNIITVGLLLNECEYISKFISDYKQYSKDESEDVYNLGLAMLAFAEKKFVDAQDYLNLCFLKDINFKLMERRCRLKVYFELGLDTLLADFINSSRKFLSQNQKSIPAFHLEANRTFFNFTYHVFYLEKSAKEKRESLLATIKENPPFPEKRWLLEKLKT